MLEELVSRVFYTRNVAHWQHWRTKSYAQHKALGHFYDDIIPALDAIVEVHQGAYDLIGNIPVAQSAPADIVKHLEDEAKWIESNHEAICHGNRAIANLIDTLSAVYLSAVYKLKNLK
jgi:hypothetical protein